MVLRMCSQPEGAAEVGAVSVSVSRRVMVTPLARGRELANESVALTRRLMGWDCWSVLVLAMPPSIGPPGWIPHESEADPNLPPPLLRRGP